MIYNLENIRRESESENPLIYRYIFTSDRWNNHEIMREIRYMTPSGVRVIPAGFKCDLASVPRFLWWWMPPFGRSAIAYVFHDDLYKSKRSHKMTRKQCDRLMHAFAKAVNGTQSPSLRNVDIKLRYYAVRLFGWVVWNKR